LKIIRNDFFTSGWDYSEDENSLKNIIMMINVAIVLSSLAMIYGIIVNYYKGDHLLLAIESTILVVNIFLVFLLRYSKKSYLFASYLVTAQCSYLILVLFYTTRPEEMKQVWLYTYPIILLYFKNAKIGLYWVIFMVFMLLIAPFQPFIAVDYSFYQLFYVSFVLVIVSLIVYLYRIKMTQANELILTQQIDLKQKVKELTKKDKMLTIQSKQAVMGEMISMIAHQWRQPLSSVTLNISNLQVKKLLGQKIDEAELDTALENISDTVVYLSETIDDFQTYFRQNREITAIDINEIIHKAISFIAPRLKGTNVEIQFVEQQRLVVHTYSNELVQVLLNIINNAVDALISRKRARPNIRINIFNQAQDVVISIADNAGGIDEESMDAIFDPYFSTKGKNGTGLGLYMSQMIMQKQFHTKIEVKNTNNGALFTIVVPKKLT